MKQAAFWFEPSLIRRKIDPRGHHIQTNIPWCRTSFSNLHCTCIKHNSTGQNDKTRNPNTTTFHNNVLIRCSICQCHIPMCNQPDPASLTAGSSQLTGPRQRTTGCSPPHYIPIGYSLNNKHPQTMHNYTNSTSPVHLFCFQLGTKRLCYIQCNCLFDNM